VVSTVTGQLSSKLVLIDGSCGDAGSEKIPLTVTLAAENVSVLGFGGGAWQAPGEP
jgi:hypothetical protein